ncbi:MAG: hypothetical protein WAT93_11620 [Pontixanthobacter sp.]
MFSRLQKTIALMLIPALSACGAATPRPVSVPAPQPASTLPNRPQTPPPTRPAASIPGFNAPRIMSIPGLEGVIGSNAAGLQRQFGTARLNVREGDALKLQFTGEACVLDIYLYPLSPGAEPTATYVDARRASDALDVGRAACVAALKR